MKRLLSRIIKIEEAIKPEDAKPYFASIRSFNASVKDKILWDVDGVLIGGQREQVLTIIRKKFPEHDPETHITEPDPERMPKSLIFLPFKKPEGVPVEDYCPEVEYAEL